MKRGWEVGGWASIHGWQEDEKHFATTLFSSSCETLPIDKQQQQKESEEEEERGIVCRCCCSVLLLLLLLH